jgi:large repetitive protein
MTLAVPLALVLAGMLGQQPRDVRPAIKLGTAALAGVVVTAETPSRPLRRAGVSVLGTDDPQVRLTTTDDSGRFVMPALPAGKYLVTVSKPPYVDTVYGARLPGRPGTQIVLKDGEKRSDLVVRMIRGGAITGVITDEHGQPAVSVGVELVQPPRRAGDQMLGMMVVMLTQMMLPRQTTDDRGMYRFSGVPPGDYIISATPVDLGGGDATVLTSETVQSAVRDLESSSKPASPTPPRPASTVIGTDERPQRPIQNAGMSFASVSEIGMTGRGGIGQTMGYAAVYYPGTTNAADAATITVSPGEERTNIDIVARPIPTARVEGVVFGPDGQPARGAMIQLRGVDRVESFATMLTSLVRTASTQADGSFTVTGVSPGRYVVHARMRGMPITTVTPGNPQPGPPPSVPGLWAVADVSVEGVPVTGLAMTLQPGMTISGRVLLEGTSPQTSVDVSTVTVVARPVQATDLLSMVSGTARVAADGTFSIAGLTPGTYRLSGQAMGSAPPQWMDVSVRLGTREVSDLAFELRPGENISDAVVTLTNRTQDLSGTLQDASGRPATEYTMIVFPADKAYWLPDSRRILTARPATDGQFAFRGMQGPPAGEYLLAAVTDLRPGEQYDAVFLDALSKQAIKLTIGPGEIKKQDVKIAK